MPQTISDPSLRPGIINNGGTDLFAYPDTPVPSILDFQADSTQPLPPGTSTATGLLTPPQQLTHQLQNFSPAVYDLSPSSVLMHFMQAILGDSGVGQMRRRQMIARLQSVLTSTRFYDLDAFYGALFGSVRGPAGTLPTNPATGLPVNPYTELASPDGWDEIEAIDARFRERIIALARAITLGGTVPGLRALAEAVSGVPCQIYEIFRLLDQGSIDQPVITWQEVTAQYPHWNSFPAGITWQQIEGAVINSGMGIGAGSEIVIQPRKSYGTSTADLQQQAGDLFGILSVTQVLQPSCSLVTVDVHGPEVIAPVPATGAWADSEYWELTTLVTPASSSDPAYSAALSAYQAGGQPPGATFQQPRPALSRGQGSQYSYAGDVTTVSAQAVSGGAVINGQNWETVIFATGPATYPPGDAVATPQRAGSARTGAATAMQSAPYSGPRVPVKTAS